MLKLLMTGLKVTFGSVSEYIVGTALKYQSDINVPKPVCLLFGGEPQFR